MGALTLTSALCVFWLSLGSVAAQKDELYRCPQGLSGSMFAFREKCYRFVAHDKHWDQAQSDCQIRGGNLVHIHDQATQSFIYRTVKSRLGWTVNGMWIGVHDQRITSKWEWVQGNPQRSGKTIRWSNWGSGQPSCGLMCIEHCGQMRFDDYGRWHDVQCHARFFFSEEKYHYACFYDMGPRTTTTTTTTTTTAPPTTTTTTPSTEPTTTGSTTPATTPTNATTLPLSTTSEPSSTRRWDVATDSDRSEPTVVAVVGAAHGSERVESIDRGMSGGTVAGIAIGCLLALCLILLLLLVFMRRRRQKKEEETPSDNFPNQTYTGGAGAGLTYINPQTQTASYLNPALSVSLPEKPGESTTENPYSECLDNEYNACAAAIESDDDFCDSKGIYEDIKLDMKSDISDCDSDEDFEGLKHKTPSVEYLHARTPPSRTAPESIPVPPRDLFTGDREHVAQDNIYVPMETGSDSTPVYQ